MERFIYICNNNELIKLIEAFGEDLEVLEVTKQTIFHDEDKTVFAIGKDEKGKVDDWYDDNSGNYLMIEKFKVFYNELKKRLIITDEDKTIISIHPGGTDDIENKLSEINAKKDNKFPANVYISYHGSKNTDIWENDKISLADLNNAVKNYSNKNDNISKEQHDKEQFEKELSLLKNEIENLKSYLNKPDDKYYNLLIEFANKETGIEIIKNNFQKIKNELLECVDDEVKRVNRNMQKMTFLQNITFLLSKKKQKEKLNNYKKELEKFKTKIVNEYSILK